MKEGRSEWVMSEREACMEGHGSMEGRRTL